MEQRSKRFTEIDFLKTIAILGVILLHINVNGTQGDIMSKTWLFSAVNGSIVRFCVPIFFMCTGVLIFDLEKDLPIKKIYGKYILKFLLVLIFWDIIYRIVDSYYIAQKGWELNTVFGHVKLMLQGKNKYHFYFLYIISFIYAFAPVVREFLKTRNMRIFTYLMILWIVTSTIIPYLLWNRPFSLHQSHIKNYSWNSVYMGVGYAMWGKYLWETRENYDLKTAVALTVIGLAAIIFGTISTSYLRGYFYVRYWDKPNPFLLIYVTGIFLLGLQAKNLKSNFFRKVSNST